MSTTTPLHRSSRSFGFKHASVHAACALAGRTRAALVLAAAGLMVLSACERKESPAPAAPAAGATSPAAGANTPSTSAAPQARDAALSVVVTIPPLKSLIEPLLPAGSRVQMLMAPGRSEHGYEFTPSDLAALGSADVVVWVGLGLEPQVDAFIARQAAGAQVRISFADACGLAQPDDHGHEDAHEGHDHHAPGHDHDASNEAKHNHGPVDPHLWVDPILVRQLVPNLQAALQHAMEKRGTWNATRNAELTSATQKLLERIDAVDAAYRTRLEPFRGRALVTHHAAFARLAERYGLKVAAVIRNVEGAEPEAGKIAEVVRAINAEKASAIFIEPQFDAALARRIAQQAGVRIGTLDPLGDGDWFATMNANLDQLTKAMTP